MTVTTADNETDALTESNTYGNLNFFGFSASEPITSVVVAEAVNPGITTYVPASTGNFYSYYCNSDTGCTQYDDYFVYNSTEETSDVSELALDNLEVRLASSRI